MNSVVKRTPDTEQFTEFSPDAPADENFKKDAEQADAVSESISDSVGAQNSKEERKLVRKLDGRILPIACLMYLFARELLYYKSPQSHLTRS